MWNTRRAQKLEERDGLQMINRATEVSRLRAENNRLHRVMELQEQDAALECDRLRANCIGYSLMSFIVGAVIGAVIAALMLL